MFWQRSMESLKRVITIDVFVLIANVIIIFVPTGSLGGCFATNERPFITTRWCLQIPRHETLIICNTQGRHINISFRPIYHQRPRKIITLSCTRNLKLTACTFLCIHNIPPKITFAYEWWFIRFGFVQTNRSRGGLMCVHFLKVTRRWMLNTHILLHTGLAG